MIDEFIDLNDVRQLPNAANMVAMEVRRDEVVDLLFLGFLREDVLNPLGVAVLETGPSGIHQDGVAARSNNERRRTPFNVNPVDVERIGGNGRQQREQE